MAEISGLKEEKGRCAASPHPCALRRKSWDQERFFLRRYAFPRFESITRVLGTGVAHLRKWANREETGRQVRSWGVDTPGLRAHQYIRGNFPTRSGPGTLTVSGAESAVSHIIPGDGRNPEALGRAGPRGWDPGRAAGGDGTRWPCHTYEQDNWCHRTEAPCEPPGATSERPRVGASRLSDGCPAARYQSAECL